jgi:glutathione S-transferase
MTTTLTYFDFEGSRGLECRLALTAAAVPFEDVRITLEQWPALKPTLPFGSLPVLTEGDLTLTQSNAILCHIGRANGLHPTDPAQASRHEALMLSVEDLRHKVPGSGLFDDEKRKAREEFAQG